ncbi:MAG: hypothetical protein FWC28_01390 [Proteobacteria bacterium]|nr:hypothetical protein [Cystobacterineae bacterium]MCL2258697.1 hypothetical protein [Cystobacterineae bacterium]MCL2313893.1 hypothetical protein [Pseudomonadota bacterium]
MPAKVWAEEKGAKLEDGIAAVVNGEVVLLSQLKFEAQLNLLRTGVSAQRLEQIPQDSWPALLDMVIAHRLWAASSERTELSIEQLSSVTWMNEKLKRAFGHESNYQQFLQKHDMDSADVLAILERIVRAESNLQAKVRLRAQPSDAEIEGARKAMPELTEEQARKKLYEEKFQLLSKQELEAQRRKADVRVLLKVSRGGL